MLKPRKRLMRAKLKEDKLVTFTAKFQMYAQKYNRQALYVLAAIVIIVGVGTIIGYSKAQAEKDAAFEELMAREAFGQGNLDEALVKANVILEDYAGTKSAAVALMIKARSHEQRGELEKAKEAYKELISDYGDSNYLAFGAYYALGMIYRYEKDYAKSIKYFSDAATKYPQHFNAPESLVDAGISAKEARKYDQAARLFHRVLNDYPKSRAADRARKDLEVIEFMP